MAPAQRRDAIVRAALPLVREHGFDVTTRQLAEAAGVAEGTLFRVFPDKETLIWAVVGAAMDPEQTLKELAAIDRALPLRARLTACVAITQRRLAGVFTLLLDALRVNGPPPERIRPPGAGSDEEISEAYRAEVIDVIGDDADQLRVPPADFVRMMRLFTFSATHPRINDGHPLTAEQIVSVLLDGLYQCPDRPGPASPPVWPAGCTSPPPPED